MPGSSVFYPARGRRRPEEWARLRKLALAMCGNDYKVREVAHELQVSENTISQWLTREKKSNAVSLFGRTA